MRYEYKVVKVATTTAIATIENSLNNQGTKGWEVISAVLVGTDYVLYLKRLIVK